MTGGSCLPASMGGFTAILPARCVTLNGSRAISVSRFVGRVMTPDELLAQHGIKIASTAPGRYYALCPQCSAGRKPENRKSKCLGVTIDANGARWGCNNCNWTGPEKGTGRANGYAGDEDFDATYDYTKDGVVRFQKVRKTREGASFSSAGQMAMAAGCRDTKGVDTTILYRIDDVNEAIAQGQLIAIAEGERDVDNLWRIGIPATCNAHGAHDPKKNQKPKWYAAHSEQLRGADIVILNDNDDSGRAHAEAAARLSVGIAARVRRSISLRTGPRHGGREGRRRIRRPRCSAARARNSTS